MCLVEYLLYYRTSFYTRSCLWSYRYLSTVSASLMLLCFTDCCNYLDEKCELCISWLVVYNCEVPVEERLLSTFSF